MSSQPELHDATATTSALVTVPPPRVSRVQGWIQRVAGFVARRPAPQPLPPDLSDLRLRTDVLERGLAAQREETIKRLEQGESRMLHHVQQRFEALETELGATLRQAVENEVAVATGSLRRWLVGAILLALVACGAAVAALYATLVRAA